MCDSSRASRVVTKGVRHSRQQAAYKAKQHVKANTGRQPALCLPETDKLEIVGFVRSNTQYCMACFVALLCLLSRASLPALGFTCLAGFVSSYGDYFIEAVRGFGCCWLGLVGWLGQVGWVRSGGLNGCVLLVSCLSSPVAVVPFLFHTSPSPPIRDFHR